MNYKAVIRKGKEGLYDSDEYYGVRALRSNLYATLIAVGTSKNIVYENADFYYKQNGIWYLIDITVPIDSKYNRMMIEAQKQGFKNVSEAVNSNPFFSRNIKNKASN